MNLQEMTKAILDSITKDAKSFGLREVSASFENAFLLLELDGQHYKIEITEVRAWRKNDSDTKAGFSRLEKPKS